MRDAWINFWVDTLGITTWLGLLGLLAVPFVIIIYLIKSKYVPKTVSSTFIWQRSLKYVKRRIPLNFIMSLLLIVQILVVIAASFALLNPKPLPRDYTATIVVVDASSSMDAKNGDKTRYEIAVDKIEELANDVDENAGMVVIFAGEKPEVITIGTVPGTEHSADPLETPYVYSVGEAKTAVKKLRMKSCASGNVDINAALELAKTSQAIDKNKNAQIYLLTDKDYSSVPSNLNIVRCDSEITDWNVGITGIRDSLLATGYQFEIDVSNQGNGFVNGGIVFTGKNKLALDKMEPNKRGEYEFTFTPEASTYNYKTNEYVIQLKDDSGENVGNPINASVKPGHEYEFELPIDVTAFGSSKIGYMIITEKTIDETGAKIEADMEAKVAQDKAEKTRTEDKPATTTFILNLSIDGKVFSHRVYVRNTAAGMERKKTFVFTARTGDVSTENKEYIKIDGVMSYNRAKITIDTAETDIISEDNISHIGSLPVTEANILYVSKNVVMLGPGKQDETKIPILQAALRANGYQIKTDSVYSASQIGKAPTTGYTLYIYEGVVPEIIPTDGTVWLLDIPTDEAKELGINISAQKSSEAGFVISKSTLITGDKAEKITNNVIFETITFPSVVNPSVSKYGVVGTVEIKENGGSTEVIVETNLPKSFETVYEASYNVATQAGPKAVRTPVMMIGEINETTKALITTFDFTNSTLPIFISDFPVLVKNMVEYSMASTSLNRTYQIYDPYGDAEGDDSVQILEFEKPNGAQSIKVMYVPNETLYDIYGDLVKSLEYAQKLAEGDDHRLGVELAVNAINEASRKVQNFKYVSNYIGSVGGKDTVCYHENELISYKSATDEYNKTQKQQIENVLKTVVEDYSELLKDIKKGKTGDLAVKTKQVGSWDPTKGETEMPVVTLDEYGTYEIVVQYKQEEILGSGNTTGSTAPKTRTFLVTTFMPDSSCNIASVGPKIDAENIRFDPNSGIEEEIQRNSILPWIVLVLIVLLIIEWGVYYRDEY